MRLSVLFLFTVISLVLLLCQQQIGFADQPVSPKKSKFHKSVPIKPDTLPDTISIAAVGDIMLGSSYPDSSRLPLDSAKSSFQSALPYFKGADIVFGNLEGTLLDSGMPAAHKKNLETGYLFRMPVKYGEIFKDAGFNLLSIANNHITDFGDKGCVSTIKTLDNYSIGYAGLQSRPDTVFERNGIKFGFCAFAPNTNTVSLLELDRVGQRISRLKKRCDVVIVSFHGGAEGAAYEHVPFKMETYLDASRGDVYAFAHLAVDSGADIVLGNGPHVSRAMERYKGRLIAYSLGNFCTYKSVSVKGVCGMAPLLKVRLTRKGEFIDGNLIAFKQSRKTGLVRDTLNTVVDRIRWLTQTDFPRSGLNISGNGRITLQPDTSKLPYLVSSGSH